MADSLHKDGYEACEWIFLFSNENDTKERYFSWRLNAQLFEVCLITLFSRLLQIVLEQISEVEIVCFNCD